MTIAGIARRDVATIQHRDLHRWLDPKEVQQHASLPPAARTDWLAGRVALKHACVRYADGVTQAPSIPVMNTPSGAPYTPRLPGLFCTLSHSQGWGVAAVASCPIGIDLEHVRPRRGSLLRYISDPQEADEARSFGLRQDAAVVRLWTIKESAMKAWGVGLGIHPRTVRVRCRDGEAITVDWMFRGRSVSRLLAFVVESDDCCIAVSTTEKVCARSVIHWTDARRVSTAVETVRPR